MKILVKDVILIEINAVVVNIEEVEFFRRGESNERSNCEYCKKNTQHERINNGLICQVCGSERLDKIQGMNAALM